MNIRLMTDAEMVFPYLGGGIANFKIGEHAGDTRGLIAVEHDLDWD